ncbi:MAG: glycosyltransferase family 9 protein [Bacteroidia bacterium]
MYSVALFRTAGVGDVVLATVAIDMIRQAEPLAEIHWFGRKNMLELVQHSFPFVHTHEIASDQSFQEHRRIIKEAATSYDVVIDLQKSLRTFLLGRWTAIHFHCPYFSWKKQSFQRTILVWQSRIRGRNSSLELFPGDLPNRYRAFADCVSFALQKMGKDIDPARFTPSIPLISSKKRSIALCLGSSYPAKELPLYKTEEILRYIRDEELADEVYFLGDGNKYTEAQALADKYPGKGLYHNLCGKTSLAEAGLILASAMFSMGNDSGLAHLSESVGTPALVFFGPTDERYGYRLHHAQSRIFSVTLGCRPCTKDGNAVCHYQDFKCFNAIPLEPVFEHMNLLCKA